jgi:hypothetical protein
VGEDGGCDEDIDLEAPSINFDLGALTTFHTQKQQISSCSTYTVSRNTSQLHGFTAFYLRLCAFSESTICIVVLLEIANFPAVTELLPTPARFILACDIGRPYLT